MIKQGVYLTERQITLLLEALQNQKSCSDEEKCLIKELQTALSYYQ